MEPIGTGSGLRELLNNARYRSLIAGAIGGLLGWSAAEVIAPVSGGAASLVGVGLMGSLVGAGIGIALATAESFVIQNWTQFQKAAVVGLVMGAIGGAVGAVSAQGLSTSAGGGSAFSTEMRDRLEQAGAKAGTIEIALSWEDTNDLDLHVIDPNGDRVWFSNKVSRSGGELDVDRNAGCNNVTNTPIEHIVWTSASPPEGTYKVCVHHFQTCGVFKPTPYRLEMKVGNAEPRVLEGTVSQDVVVQSVQDLSRIPVTTTFEFPQAAPNRGSGAVRLLGWTLFGLLVGLAQGVVRRSLQTIRNAALGGMIGGFIGGLLFGAIAASGVPDVLSRLVGFMVLGACIGICIVLVEQALSAVLWVTAGRQEGRQIFLDRPEMRLGRDDSLEIYLGGDPDIVGHHATIRREGNEHVIEQVGGTVVVNGAASSKSILRDGDRFQLGLTRFRYGRREDGTGMTGTTTATPAPSKPPPPPPALGKQPQRPVSSASTPSTPATPRKENKLPPPPPPPPPALTPR